jgi:MFS family permease
MTVGREGTGSAAPGRVTDERQPAGTTVADAIGDPDAQTLTLEADAVAPPQAVGRQGGTFDSFRHRDFRLFWSGALLSNVGSWMQAYALGIVVFGLRGSSFDLGLVNFLSGVPVLVLALPAGAIADRVDRRRLLIVIQVVLLVQAAALGVLYNLGLLGPRDPVTSLFRVAALGLVGGVSMAFMAPAFQSMMPDLVPRRLLMNGIALNSAQFQSSRLLGPLAAAGVVLAGAGMGEVFYVNAASFLFVIAALGAMRLRPEGGPGGTPGRGHGAPPGEGPWRQASWRALTAGLRYALEDRTVGVLVLSTAIVTICAFPYMTLLPAIVSRSLGFEGRELSRAVAFVMAANGLGALAGALGVASLPATFRRGRFIPLSLVALGVLLIGFALSRWLPLTLLLSTLAGAALLVSTSLTNTSIQAAAPAELRGRVMSLYVLAFLGMMPISGLVFGTLGEAVGPARAVLVGALLLLAWAAVLLARPAWLCPAQAVGAPRPCRGG